MQQYNNSFLLKRDYRNDDDILNAIKEEFVNDIKSISSDDFYLIIKKINEKDIFLISILHNNIYIIGVGEHEFKFIISQHLYNKQE